MKDVFLGIDLGTGGARAGLFDDEGHALAFKDSPVVSHYPHPGWVEQSAEDWWEALVNSVRAVVAATGVKPEQIRGIGYDATSATVVAVVLSTLKSLAESQPIPCFRSSTNCACCASAPKV